METGSGPFAIDRGLVEAADPVAAIRVFNINTKKVIELVVQTPGGRVIYEGKAQIDGVPGVGAPIALNFLDAAGANGAWTGIYGPRINRSKYCNFLGTL